MNVSTIINDLINLFSKQSQSSEDFGNQFANIYETFAYTCIPSPVLIGRKPMLAQLVIAGSASLNGPIFIESLNIGLTQYWLAAPLVIGGATTCYLGSMSLSATLYSMIGVPKTAEVAGNIVGNALWVATQQVQYFIPPGTTGFLV